MIELVTGKNNVGKSLFIRSKNPNTIIRVDRFLREEFSFKDLVLNNESVSDILPEISNILGVVDPGSYGYKSVEPIVSSLLIIPNNTIVAIEYPENGLHPESQLKLVEFFVNMSNSGKHIILETHSDHIMMGVRVAVKQKRINPSDVIINYLSSEVDTINPEIDHDGRISTWPEGFFDDISKNLATLASNVHPRFKANPVHIDDNAKLYTINEQGESVNIETV